MEEPGGTSFFLFFCLVAMESPEVMGRNGNIFFCAHLCQHLMGGLGRVVQSNRGQTLQRETSHSHIRAAAHLELINTSRSRSQRSLWA